MTEREKAFRKAVQAACDRYGFNIDGCGCCNSPYLYDIMSGKEVGSARFDADKSAEMDAQRSRLRKQQTGDDAYSALMEQFQ